MVLSAIPFACGLRGAIVKNYTRISSKSCLNSPKNSVPLSVTTYVGLPNLLTKSHIQFAVVVGLLSLIGYTSTHLENESTNMNRYLFPLAVASVLRSLVRSICNTANGLFPFSVGCRLGLFMNLGFICEQCTHYVVNLVTSLLSVGHQYLASTISYKAYAP